MAIPYGLNRTAVIESDTLYKSERLKDRAKGRRNTGE